METSEELREDVNPSDDWLMRPDVCPLTGTHLCRICGSLTSNIKSFNTHRSRKHGTIRHTVICPVEPTKCPKSTSMNKLREHLLKEHDVQLVPEKRSFASKADFLKWKEEMELATVAHFVSHSFQGERREVLHCNRTGERENRARNSRTEHDIDQKSRNKKVRAKGSAKIGAHCPAMLTVLHEEDGRVNVEAYLTHLGHDHDVRYLPVPKSTRERSRTLLQSGNDISEVVRILKRESAPGERTCLITPKMVIGMRRWDQERINEAHLDSSYLLLQPELIVETKPNQEWLVQSSTDDKQFVVTRTEHGCLNQRCHIRCDSCVVCPHQYTCSCPRRAHLPCMHIHGVHVHTANGQRFDAQLPTVSLEGDALETPADEDNYLDDSEEPNETIANHSPIPLPKLNKTRSQKSSTTDLELKFSNESIKSATLSRPTAILSDDQNKSQPIRMTNAALQKLSEMEKRVLLKFSRWKDMWECLAVDGLLEALTLGEQLEEMLNEALSKAQTAPKIRKETTTVLPKVRIDNALPKTPDSVQFTNKRKRNFIPLEQRREIMAKRMAAEKSIQDSSSSAASSQVGTGVVQSLTTAPSTQLSTAFASSGTPSGKVIVLRFSKKPTTNLAITTPIGHQLRPIRQLVRCIACHRVIGSNHMSAEKCTKCAHWCHTVCSHLCVD